MKKELTSDEYIIYYGRREPPVEIFNLSAGPLNLIFDPQNAMLRYISINGKEILRGIYVAVRDKNWGTVLPKITEMSIVRESEILKGINEFKASFAVECKKDDIDFHWEGRIIGQRDGRIRYMMKGCARSTFMTNRIGFCVLYPIHDVAGKKCIIEKVNGEKVDTNFPYLIDPNQPPDDFTDIKSITYEISPGLYFQVIFNGNVFEMEDQRNWTDGSYKVYCPPLRLPYPVEVKKGQIIEQSIELRIKDGTSKVGKPHIAYQNRTHESIKIYITDETVGRLPRIGVCLPSYVTELSPNEIRKLRKIAINHLRLELNLNEPDGLEDKIKTATTIARNLGTPLEVCLVLPKDLDFSALKNLLDDLIEKSKIFALLIFSGILGQFPISGETIDNVRKHVSRMGDNILIGTGTNSDFLFLNRHLKNTNNLDIISYAINPQVHAFDNLSLIETLEGQIWTVKTAAKISGGLPVAVSPLTLKPRFNPYSPSISEQLKSRDLSMMADPRQMSLFGAGWTLGSLKFLSENGIFYITCYEAIGPLGLIEFEDKTILKEFPSKPGMVFPMYHLFVDLTEYGKALIKSTNSTDPRRAIGLTLHKDGKYRTLLANLTNEYLPIVLSLPKHHAEINIKRLNGANVKQAMFEPETFRGRSDCFVKLRGDKINLCLSPYEIIRIDF